LRKFPVLFVALVLCITAFAQPVYTLSNSDVVQIKSYALLPDRGYNFDKILADSSLPFSVGDSLRPAQFSKYWLKLVIANPFREAIPYNVQIGPALNNTLYYYDANARNWVNNQAGILNEQGRSRINNTGMTCIMQAQTTNTLYVLIDVKALEKVGYAMSPDVRLQKGSVADKQERTIWITWITSLTVLFLFFLNNVYVWVSFKDKTVLSYLTAQLGGMVFVTAYKFVFPVLFHSAVYTIDVWPNGVTTAYSLNDVLLHLSILVVMYSMVQFCRSYLNTRQLLPRLDELLKFSLYVYLPLSFIFIVINTLFVCTETWYWLVDNIFSGVLFATIIYTGWVGYRRKLPASSVFLLANIVSIGFMLALPVYHLLASFNDVHYSLVKSLLPDLIIITQTFGFSVALVARTRAIQRNLAAKEEEARQLEADLQEIAWRHAEIEQENQKITTEIAQEKTRNEELQEKLAANQRELASSTLYMVQKNELLTRLKAQIKELNNLNPDHKKPELQQIESTLQKSMYLDADWAKFKLHFEQVHPHFFKDLQSQHPTLTKNEIRLCAYFHINLSTKEIASLLNIDPASVRRAKTRLYKKMEVNQINSKHQDPRSK
jgi:DNA-binding CsgD family transcriptional regulator